MTSAQPRIADRIFLLSYLSWVVVLRPFLWQSDSLTEWFTERVIHWHSNLLIKRFTQWFTYEEIHWRCVIDMMLYWRSDSPIEGFTNRVILLTERFTDRVIHWHWLADRMIYCLNDLWPLIHQQRFTDTISQTEWYTDYYVHGFVLVSQSISKEAFIHL